MCYFGIGAVERGYELQPARLPNSLCDSAVAELNNLCTCSPNVATFADSSVHIHNPFLHSHVLRDLMNTAEVANLVVNRLGSMYILRNIVASNVMKRSNEHCSGKQGIGFGWHRDTPQFYTSTNASVCMPAGYCYQLVIALEDTNEVNSTKILDGSHEYSTSKAHRWGAEEMNMLTATYRQSDLILRKGEICLLDDNTIHRAGEPTAESRWVLFMSITPWYIRPYFKYDELIPRSALEAQLFGKSIDTPRADELIRCSFKRSA